MAEQVSQISKTSQAPRKIGVVADCVCDLPKSYLQEHGIDIIYFLIETDNGIFTDTDEITSANILEYMEGGGGKSLSSPPPAEVYKSVFENALKKHDEIIHVAISSGISLSCQRAEEAIEAMGEDGRRVHVVDSMHLSSGVGAIVMKAAELAEKGAAPNEIVSALEKLRERVSTTFLTLNADYLFRSHRVSENVKKLCDIFNVHPVLTMKNGKIALKTALFGNYEKASLRYVRKQLKPAMKIENNLIFITQSGCTIKKTERLKEEANKIRPSDETIVTKASATISSSCGPNTFGVMFIKAEN